MIVQQRKIFPFLTDIAEKDNTPEFNGYDTRTSKSKGQSLQPKTRAVYLQLVDSPPAYHANLHA